MLFVFKPVACEQNPKHFQIETRLRFREPEFGEFRSRGGIDLLVNSLARHSVSSLGSIELSFQSLAQGASHK